VYLVFWWYVSGALPSLKMIVVNSEHERHPQLIAVCKRRGIEIA